MKKYLGFVALALFVALLGCGGGGGGGTTGSTDGSSSGSTNADPNSTIVGRVVSRATGNPPVAGVVVRFYNSSNVQVGSATSRANGYFDALLGVDAVKFNLDNTSFSHSSTNGFNSIFRYNGQWYFSSDSTCMTTLPSIVPGFQKTLPSTIGLSPVSEPPAPPPGGCQP